MSKNKQINKEIKLPVQQEEIKTAPIETVPVVQEEKNNDEFFPKFNFRLVVKNPFKKYKKGQLINSQSAIQEVVDSGNLPNCCKTLI